VASPLEPAPAPAPTSRAIVVAYQAPTPDFAAVEVFHRDGLEPTRPAVAFEAPPPSFAAMEVARTLRPQPIADPGWRPRLGAPQTGTMIHERSPQHDPMSMPVYQTWGPAQTRAQFARLRF
jgi:hypothetical protein